MEKVIATVDKCTVTVEEAVSKKGNVYKRLILVANGKKYIVLDNNLINSFLIDSLLAK